HRDGVPELRDLAAHERVPERGLPARGRRSAAVAHGDRASGDGGPRARRTGRARIATGAAAVRRTAAAARAGPRARPEAEAAPPRRAALQPRREAPSADAH